MGDLAIITGASTGIGFEIAKYLLSEKKDLKLLLISSNIDKLNLAKEKLNSENVEILAQNLENFDISKIKEAISNRKIKYFINNAGFGDFGNFIDCNIEKQEKMIDLNIKALTKLSHFILNEVKETKEKVYILNVASVASFMSGPLMSVYYATKAYVLSFTRAIRYENKNEDIVISCLCPGPTTTNFIKSSNLEGSKLFSSLKNMSAETVAKIAIKSLEKEKELIIPGFLNKLMVVSAKIFPDKLVRLFVYRIMKSK